MKWLLFWWLQTKIWARRNAVLHGFEFKHPSRVLGEAEELQKSLQTMPEENRVDEHEVRRGDLQRWECPPHGWFKLNWDVAIDIHSKCMGFGAIIWDMNGRVCAARSVKS